MLQQYHTKLKGTLALTDSYLTEKALQKEKGLYKFIWVRNGSITVEIDHQEMILTQDEVISLTHLQHLEFKSIDGEYLTLLFNSNFYCIYGNDHEVSCSGFLFNGSSHVVRFMLNESERRSMEDVVGLLDREFTVSDNLQEEMLRILLKRFIIQSTRIARQRLNITQEKEYSFEIIRQYYNLVDEHFRTKKQVQDYADLLHKSPKTLSNIFSSCKLPSPLRVIHERVEHADGIGAAAHRRDDHIGKPPGFFQHLGTGFAPDDALKIPDQRGEGVRTRRRTETIVCGLLRGDPITQGLVDGVLEGPGAALDGPDFSAEQLHAPHVGGLALHVLGTHENDAFKPQTGGGSGCRHAVLARAGFRDQRRFAHMLGEQRLPERVVDLVRAGVQQILAFQPQREAEPFGQSGAVG